MILFIKEERISLERGPVIGKSRTACLGFRNAGFTLIELVMVIVVLGILAVFASPSMFNSQDYYARGFHDETLALLRYGQKAAIAQRRTVCVAFESDSAKLRIASAEPPSSNCDTDLVGPNGTLPYTVTAKPDVNYAPVPTGFSFNALGQPINALGQLIDAPDQPSVQVDGYSQAISVEANTGYVHE